MITNNNCCIELIHFYGDNIPSDQLITKRIFNSLYHITMQYDTIDIQIVVDDVHIQQIPGQYLNNCANTVVDKISLLYEKHLNIGGLRDRININTIFESSQYDLNLIQTFMAHINKNLIHLKKRGITKQIGIDIDNQFVGLYHKNEDRLAPTCFCYSLCMALKRVQCYDNITIFIEEEFKNIEENVKSLLRLAQQHEWLNNQSRVISIPKWVYISQLQDYLYENIIKK